MTHYDTIKLLLKTTAPKVMFDNGPYALVKPWLGDGLLLSSGNRWHRNRKLLTPAFHFEILKGYINCYNKAADVLLDVVGEKAAEDKSVEIFSRVQLCTLDVILKCAFSWEMDVQKEGQHSTYVQNVLSLSHMVMERAFNLIWYIDWIYKRTSHYHKFKTACDQVHNQADEVIQKRRAKLEADPTAVKERCQDFLDILLLARDENDVGLTDLEIRSEVDTFLFAGHDTTASAISWCLYNLACHPECQQKAQQEVDELLSDRTDVNWNDLQQLPYLTQCIRESLRLVPPVPVILRDLDQPLTVEGVTLLPRTIMSVSLWDLHHNESIWGEDHMEFNPERLSTENMNKMDSHAFLPFSAGPRNCIGQNFAMNEMKVVLAKFLRRYTFTADESHKAVMRQQIVMHAKDGIKLKLKLRQ